MCLRLVCELIFFVGSWRVSQCFEATCKDHERSSAESTCCKIDNPMSTQTWRMKFQISPSSWHCRNASQYSKPQSQLASMESVESLIQYGGQILLAASGADGKAWARDDSIRGVFLEKVEEMKLTIQGAWHSSPSSLIHNLKFDVCSMLLGGVEAFCAKPTRFAAVPSSYQWCYGHRLCHNLSTPLLWWFRAFLALGCSSPPTDSLYAVELLKISLSSGPPDYGAQVRRFWIYFSAFKVLSVQRNIKVHVEETHMHVSFGKGCWRAIMRQLIIVEQRWLLSRICACTFMSL